MQPKSRFLVLGIIALMAVLLAGCGGGTTGKTWFNLPSFEVEVNQAGGAKVAGFNLPLALLQPAQIEQLQSANVQQLEARIGYGGVSALVNGEDLPYLAWDAESAAVLQEKVQAMPGLPNSGLIARVLPWLRTIGLGAAIQLPPAGEAIAVPRWRGETTVAAAEAPAEPTIGPIDISNITFNAEGRGFIGPVPLDALGAGVALPASTLALLQQLGINSLSLHTEPTGLKLDVNDGPFPDLAYDAERLAKAMELANTFMAGSPMVELLNGVAGQLPGADIRAAVTFNGEPAGGLVLDNLRATINEDGSIDALGLPLPVGSLLSPELVGQLQSAGLERLQVSVSDGTIALANNGAPFPAISWTGAGEQLLTSMAPALGLPAGQLQGIFDVVRETDLALEVALPGADTTAPAPEVAEFAPVDLGDVNAPEVRARLQVDGSGTVTQVGNVATADLAALGVPPITLPANVMQMLGQTGASNVQVQTTPGQLDVSLDGESALSLNYDVDSLRQLVNTLKPILNNPMLENPIVSKLLDEMVLPMVAGSNIDLTVALQ